MEQSRNNVREKYGLQGEFKQATGKWDNTDDGIVDFSITDFRSEILSSIGLCESPNHILLRRNKVSMLLILELKTEISFIFFFSKKLKKVIIHDKIKIRIYHQKLNLSIYIWYHL